jgi:chromosomal replication initiation ATPase DnaA
MRPGPVQMQFHASHKEARRRLYRAGDHLAALEAAKECAAREALQQALQQAQQEASDLRAKLAKAESAKRKAIFVHSPRPPIPAFAAVVAKAHGMKVSEMLARRRQVPIIHARFHLIAVLTERRPDMGLQMIANAIGGYDHSTIVNARKKWQKYKHRYGPEIAAVNAEIGPDPEACTWER